MLEIEQLSVQFGGLIAVNRLDLAVERGAIDSVIGPNGAGKTTVFNAVTGIYEPTAGTIRFEQRDLRRPLTAGVVAVCAVVGLLTAVATTLAAVNVDLLWRAAIKRNYDGNSFSYADAWRSGWQYVRGDLALEQRTSRSTLKGRTTLKRRWTVTTADGRKSLGDVENKAEAEALAARLQQVIDQPDLATVDPLPANAAGEMRWAIVAPNRRAVSDHASEVAARTRLGELAEIGRQQRAGVRTAWLAAVVGLVLGASGTYAMWNRSRRTPDVISLGGIARTFQNIRLFHNMTVVENVLVGMDRSFHAGVFRIMLRTPGLRRAQREGLEKALGLLEFVGLAGQRHELAKNLPYGDQRRLEIARALATEPRLLLLDEPAAGMNPLESQELMMLIRKIRDRGITILLIEHHMKLVMDISDRIAVLDHGLKIAEGTPAEVRADAKVIEAYLGKEEVG